MKVHLLLCAYELAPALLARFENGLIYRYLRGSIPSHRELVDARLWKAIARKLGEWHAVLPAQHLSHSIVKEVHDDLKLPNGCTAENSPREPANGVNRGASTDGLARDSRTDSGKSEIIAGQTFESNLQTLQRLQGPGAIEPSLWTVTLQWIHALPRTSDAEKTRQKQLLSELFWVMDALLQDQKRPGAEVWTWPEIVHSYWLTMKQTTVSHCDLLSANVVIEDAPQHPPTEDQLPVSFIDYEYTVPSPAAFDLANHFAEWVGYECNYSLIPTRSQRLDFIREYLTSRSAHLEEGDSIDRHHLESTNFEGFSRTVDDFRGMPGFYWGVWALIQAQISEIDFDYASYAELRLQEYWDWKSSFVGVAPSKGSKSVREQRWNEE